MSNKEENIMSFVSLTTTKTLTLHQEVALKKATGRLISIIPNQKEQDLMIHIEDNQVMYFMGKELECMKIEVQLSHTAELDDKKEFTKKLLAEVQATTKIPVSQIYLTIEEYENWGKDGKLL